VFNGMHGTVDRSDFVDDHGPGEDYHGDAQVLRFDIGVTRVENVPSHMSFDPSEGMLYIADTGGARILRLDPNSGTRAGPFEPNYDGLEEHELITGATVTEVVPPGVLQQPSGLVVHENVIFASDYATGRVHAFDKSGVELASVATPMVSGVGGMTVGPEGKLYFVEKAVGKVWRIDPD
jgi:sugar lactone lactonase YvrE